jgi:hypothetical protein
MMSSIATLVLTLFVAHVSLQTQERQAASEARQNQSEQEIKKQNLLNEVLKMATDNSAGQDRRIAGIRALGQFWKEQAYEETIASTLVAELGLEGDNERFARCAAADVIGKAIMGEDSHKGGAEDERSRRIAQLLYGNRMSGLTGLVTRQQRLLVQSGQQIREESDTDQCLTPLGASREAIRLNSEYLRQVNLSDVDLSGADFSQADLGEASLNHAMVRETIFSCANLYQVDLTGLLFDTDSHSSTGSPLGIPHFRYSNVKGAGPPEIIDWMKQHHYELVELDDAEWQLWRKNGFRVDRNQKPILDAALNKNGAFCPCEQSGSRMAKC